MQGLVLRTSRDFLWGLKHVKITAIGILDPREAHHRLTQTLELLEVQKELNKAGDAAQHPELKPEELEGRFWRRMRARKDLQWEVSQWN